MLVPCHMFCEVLAPLAETDADLHTVCETAITHVTNLLTPTRCAGHAFGFTLRITHNDDVQQLNHEFRHKDKPTNVLSFPTDDADAWDEDDELMYLGDIIIAAGVVTAEANAQHKDPLNHLQHLVIHGFLHLCGYDHHTEPEATMMENVEIRALRALNITNPYQDEQ